MAKAEDAQKIVKPSADGLFSAAAGAAKKGPPPVHLWNPAFCGDIDMRIARDGTWFYLGTPIGRAPMVKLFSSILKLEDGKYYLVTPVEKVGIRVIDAPFVAVDADIHDTIDFTTNVGDRVTAGPDHAIEMRGTLDAPRPYVHIRRDLWALIDRKTFYRLADAAMPGANGRMEVHSGGTVFPLEN